MRTGLFRISALVCGIVFALGLGIAGMGTPARVLAFLDVGGAWDPSLAFVMMGAIAVHFTFAIRARKLSAPLLDRAFVRPTLSAVDKVLIAGAALFGVGWGLQGYCPGPAVLAIASLDVTPLLFFAAMIGGMIATRGVQGLRE